MHVAVAKRGKACVRVSHDCCFLYLIGRANGARFILANDKPQENKTRLVFLSDLVCSSPDKFLKGRIFNHCNTFTRNRANSNIELARAKSEALVNILINKKIKSCYAKRVQQ